MKTTAIAAIAAALCLCATAPAQDYNSSISSGPWSLRHSTGDKAADRVWFVMDRTLNSCEQRNLTDMFRTMPGNEAYVLEKAICASIDSYAKNNANYGTYMVSDYLNDNGMSDYQIYNGMKSELRPEEREVLGQWLDTASDSQIMAVGKLVRCGGWANTVWTAGPMNSG